MAHMRSAWFGGTSSNGGRYRTSSTSAVKDLEKRRISGSSDETPSNVSSEHPMLSQSSPRPKNYALRYHLPRRRFTRYFTCGLVGIIVLLAVYLLVASWSNETKIRLGLKKAPPPPPIWESFPFLKRYHGGIRTLVRKEDNVPEYPNGEEDQALTEAAMRRKLQNDNTRPKDPGFQKRDPQAETHGRIPKGVRFDPYSAEIDYSFEKKFECHIDPAGKVQIPQLLAYPGVPEGFPDPIYGSHDIFGLRNDVCFERYGKLGPYGYGYSRKFGGSSAGLEGEKEGSEEVWGDQLEVDYRDIKWAEVQARCMEANKHRFRPPVGQLNHIFTSMAPGGPAAEEAKKAADADKDKQTDKMIGEHGRRLVPRTAVVIRTWKDYNYDQEDLFYLRSIMSELALQSGTEYVVHFLIHVKDLDLQIWADDDVYQRVLNEALPAEFRGMGTLWSERQMNLVYGGVADTVYRNLPVFGVYRSTYMPLQYFAHQHPEYDFFWHWEMDIRYTGHFHHLFDKISSWATEQPRKGLWERNARFYIPSVHGSWEDFRKTVRAQTEGGNSAVSENYLGTDANTPEKPIWGPVHPRGQGDEVADPERDPVTPRPYEEDKYEWGVGEEADFITFNPLFDPHNTNWLLAEDVTGYNTTKGFPPRRTAIITASRLSKRLLDVMHRETTFKRHTMFSEMWPGSMALQHGLKAVYAPHPVYTSRRWPITYLSSMLNNGLHGASGGSRFSIFSDERQHNFYPMTFYYNARFSENLWKRWLGYRVEGEGGEDAEVNGEGRMCLPAMLIHPVKQVDLVYEHKAGE